MNRKLFLLIFCFTLIKYSHAQSWQSLGGGASFSVYALAVDSVRDELYVGGWFDRVGSTYVNGIAKWDGLNWHVLNGGVNAGGSVKTILIYNNEVYVGGNFDSIGGIAANNVARWDHNRWHPVGQGFNDNVNCLVLHNGEIFAGGSFNYSGTDTVLFVAKWNGSKWMCRGKGLTGDAITLFSNTSDLLAGGLFGSKIWLDTIWNTLGSQLGGKIYSYYNYGTELFTSGNFQTSTWPYKRFIAKWANNDWQTYTYPLTSGTLDPGIRSMTEYNGSLIITGHFNTPKNIGIYSPLTLDSLSAGISGPGLCLTTFRGDLIVGGLFSFAGNQVAGTSNLARWTLNTNISTLTPYQIFKIQYGNNSFYRNIPFECISGNCQIEIYNLLGQKVNALVNNSRNQIFIPKTSGGIHLIRVNNKHHTFILKIFLSENL
ncbi:MAG: T9SS C-terminal target domain-containing protein [Bacteroidetes bacterium]|nr:MAG: T9SS C-terminal target domain-containing protein [Bacteroidota bacterium]REK04985.1 MAG: T9SS C-terminal target domain-containing protein [Bacteroidota bacterium]REK36511.1 MAG: T9SS C-terminal target domain-containing protein [Bacteroidota bacterium]